MKLDLPTLGIFSALIYLSQVLALLVQYRVNRAYQGIGWWLAGSACAALGFLLLAAAPMPWARLGMFGNPLLVAGRLCLLVGVLRFLERPWNRWWIGGFYLATLAAYYYFLFGQVSLVGRTCTIASAIAVSSLLVAYPLCTARQADCPTGSARFTGVVFLLHGLFLLLVCGFTLLGPAVTSYRDYAPIQVAAFVIPALTGNLCTFGLILMVNQRLNQAEIARSELETRNRQLQKAESLGRMAGAIAHHFNNRLQSVLLNLELAELPRHLAGDPGPYLRKARTATELAGEVSRHMLAYLGQTTGEREPHALAEICRGCRPILLDTLSGRALEWDLPAAGPWVVANAPELQEVLVNLVTNAVEASTSPVRVRVATLAASRLDPEGRCFPLGWQPPAAQLACLEVADSGPGIAEADLDQLFDPFYTTKFPGRGLGLPVALGIAQAHGGAIMVASRPGQGSTFTVLLPLHAERKPDADPAAAAPPRIRPAATVLLVDDDPLVLESVGTMIERLGFDLLTAMDGAEALAVFATHREAIRCVVTDLTMPRMDGWEVLAELRRQRPGLPVVMATGYSQGQAQSAPHAEKPQAFLWKPFSREQLEEVLDRAMG